MYRYIISRILLVFPTLIGAAALVFLLMRLVPGDICLVRLGSGGTSFTQQALASCHAEIGIDRPWILQFLDFLWGLARLDFGKSMWSGKPVIQEIATRFPISLEVAVMATIIAVVIAIPLGTISALKQNSWIDLVVRTFSIAGLATPAFWLGIVSILIVLDVTQAISGHPWMPPIDYVPLWKDPIRNLSIVMLPALTIGYRYAAVSMRMTRSAMLEVLREDYIRTARAKGLIRRLIINRHALKNALLPVVTVIGIEFAFLLGGLVVTEQVFNLNGIGRLMVLSVQNQDYTLTQALVMVVVTIAVLSNLVVDLLYAWLDPRIRLARRGPPDDHRNRPNLRHRPRPCRRARPHAARPLGRCGHLFPSPAGRRDRPRAGVDLRARRDLRRMGRAVQPDLKRFRRDDRAAELGALARHRPARPRSVVAHSLRRPHRLHCRHDLGPGRRLLGAGDRRRQRLFRRPARSVAAARPRHRHGVPADHHGAGGRVDLRHRHPECHRRDHDPADPALRPHRALLGPGDPRSALCRRGARPRLRPHQDHHAPHGAERDGT